MKTDQSNQARIDVFLGSTGTGKSTSIKALIAAERPPRLLVWDYMHEEGYAKLGRVVYSAADFIKALDTSPRIVFRPNHDKPIDPQFDLFCRAAFALGGCCVVFEELSAVTRPSWAPPSYRKCLVMGRHRAMWIIGASQRPALIDKTIFSQATTVRTGRLLYEEDCATMARVLRLKGIGSTPDDIGTLADGEYFERQMRSGLTTRGAIFGPSAGAKTQKIVNTKGVKK